MPIFLQDYIDWLWFMVPYWKEDWAKAFLFTQVVEIPFYMWAFKRSRPELRWYVSLLLAFGASAITHPFVWFFFPYFSMGRDASFYWNVVVPLAEAFAVGVEALYLWKLQVKNPLAWAFLANGASFGIGLLSRDVFHWW
jgi:hypothetical protein